MAIKVFSKNSEGQLIELQVRRKLQKAKLGGVTKLIEHFADENFVYQVTSLMNMSTLQTVMERTSMPYLTLQEM